MALNFKFSRIKAVGDRFSNALTLVDIANEDSPLIYVNPAFEALTGYTSQEVIGKNCRFLQGIETSKRDVLEIRSAIKKKFAVYCDLINYRKSGEVFYNRLILLPLLSDSVQYYAGLQLDVSQDFVTKLNLGNSFEDLKVNDRFRDSLNTQLMKIQMSLSLQGDAKQCELTIERAFVQMLGVVRSFVDSNSF